MTIEFQNEYNGRTFLLPRPHYLTNVHATVNHFQLKDLLQVDQRSGDLYYTKSYSIWKLANEGNNDSSNDSTSAASGGWRALEVLKPEYSPKCFHVNGGLAAGGITLPIYRTYYPNVNGISKQQKGLFSFTRAPFCKDSTTTVKLGGMLNNSVFLDGSSAYVSNNDCHLYSLDIGKSVSLKAKLLVEPDVPLNYVAKNPQSSVLTVTGDTSTIYVIDSISNSSITKIKTSHDTAFSISYHPNGNLFSTVFQDGHCLIYDLRNLAEPLHTITSTRPGNQSGAFRCCKFSNNRFSDILAISEHVGRVHLIDLRNPSHHQVVVFPFALDQFGDSKGKKDQICDIPIYEGVSFTAPLVYDYDYVTDVNPALFKYYTYKQSEQLDLYNAPTESSLSAYQDSDNHIHGEMELAGLDWHQNQLYIGCENGGVLRWDVNNVARRSFGLGEFV